MIRQTKEGIWVIDQDSHHTVWIEQSGRLDHDRATLPAIKQYIPQGGVVVDGGAHVGSHTCFYLDCVGPEGTVISFEPNPPAYRCLVRNCPNATTYQLALGNECGSSWIRYDQNYGGAFLDNIDCGTMPVFTVGLDALNLDRLDFLKLDVEGCEIMAMGGASWTIAKCRPVMLIEVNSGALARQGVTPQDLYDQIAADGYRYEYLFPSHHMNMPQTDIICFPKP